MFSLNKRLRDEDEEELSDLRNEHKKLRALPFRASPTTKHSLLFSQSARSTPTPKPATLTPAESSEDDEYFSSTHRTSQHKLLAYQSAPQTMQVDLDLDSDLDMTDSQPPDSPVWTKGDLSPTLSPTTRPCPQVPHFPNERTRIPTPIYGYFPSQDPSSIAVPSNLTSTAVAGATTTTTFSSQSNIPASHVHHSLFFNRRSLPSPISEDESMDSPTTMTGTMLRRLNMNRNSFSKTSPTFGDKASDSMETNEPTPANSPSEHAMAEDSIRFRHQSQNQNIRDLRRGAVSNINAIPPAQPRQQQGKMVLSMGFRADCEKCRERVPGHWSHVLRI